MDITTVHSVVVLALTLIRLAFEIVIVTEENKTDPIYAALKDSSLRRIGVGLNMPITLYELILSAAFESDMSVHDYVIEQLARHMNWENVKKRAPAPKKIKSK